jgi:hypothetical protein
MRPDLSNDLKQMSDGLGKAVTPANTPALVNISIED